jgi:ABC-2 type transport system permease protein
MTGTLVCKLLRDIRLPFVVVGLLLMAFQCLWVKITERISAEVLPQVLSLAVGSRLTAANLEALISSGPGRILKTLLGGESISFFRISDMLTVGYVHPTMITIFSIWAIGRAAGAVTGELDRGTLELLLAQPLPRWRVLLAHFCIDLIVIPLLCLCLWLGTFIGLWLMGIKDGDTPVDAARFAPALWNVAALMFAISGYTIWLSARGRFRPRVLGLAVFVTLVQFLVNVVAQLWDALAPMRPFTVFYYYQPQKIILSDNWSMNLQEVWHSAAPLWVNVLAVLFTVGCAGYGLAFWTFCRRDLPAPL